MRKEISVVETPVTLNAACQDTGYFFVQHRHKGHVSNPTRVLRCTNGFALHKDKVLSPIPAMRCGRRTVLTRASMWFENGPQSEMRVLA